MPDETTKSPVRQSERIGKYEILDHIASGGMGMVYLARDADLDRKVALKILPAEMAKQPVTRMRFQREAKAAAQLRHENIVAIFDVGEHEGMPFIALEYIEGTDLQAYINRKCRLDPEDARTIMLQATRALVHAHEQGIVHRDIKPSNFLLMFKNDRLIVKLTDFGLAIRHENPEEFRITRDRTTVGTVDYMSPEQARDSRSADIRSDIYSLGCTFYHMLAGAAPFARGSMPERLLQHMNAAPPNPRKLNKAIPPYLVAIIFRMLAKKPEDRYQTPADLLDHLEHPNKVPLPRKKTSAARPGRETNYRKPGNTTAVIENRVVEEASAEPAQVKAPEPEQAGSLQLEDDRPVYDTALQKESPATVPEEQQEPAPEAEITNFGTDIEDDEFDEDEDVEDEDEEDEDEEDDDDEEEEPKQLWQNPLVWMGGLAGSIVVLGLVLILAFAFRGRNQPPVKATDKKPAPPPIVEVIEKPPPPEEPPPPKIDTSPRKMTVPEFVLPRLESDPTRTDPGSLRREFTGPFGSFPEVLKSMARVLVRRLASVDGANFPSLHDALTANKDTNIVIDIADNGPIFVSTLPGQFGRTITLRGAPGYRPLVIWDTSKADPKTSATMLTLAHGKLILDNLDIAVKWVDDAPGTLFDLPDTHFLARDCTFTIAGKSSGGITLVRRAADKESLKTQTHLLRCYVRGGDATLVALSGVSADVLLEDSLVVGRQQPIIHLRAKEPDTLTLHCVRSTVTTAQMLIRWQPLPGKAGGPRIHGRILDSILSRYGPSMLQGNLLHLPDAADLSKLSWRASNSVYTGWKQLIAASTNSIPGHDQDGWRKAMKTGDGERILENPWPNDLPSLDELAADTFLPAQTPVGFAAIQSPGTIGSVIGWLPPTPDGWFNRAFKQRLVDVIINAPADVPRITAMADGHYHGERLDLMKVKDLGAHLADRLEKMPPAPRVVMHLTGKGVRETSPLRIKGVQHLILYFEKDAKDPLTLETAPIGFKQRAPMIEMNEGHLELINARLRLSNITFIPSLIEMQSGNLTLTGCFLQGPLVRASENFKHLIGMTNSGAPPTTLMLRNNTLIAGKALVRLNHQVQLRARNNLCVGLGDGIHLDGGTEPGALSHVLEQNTLAVRQAFFAPIPPSAPVLSGGPIVLHGTKNVFLTPFKDEEKPTLLRGGEAWSAQGVLTWQGRGNVYDPRLHSYFAPLKTVGPRQSLKDWVRAWGPVAEPDAQLLDAVAATRTLLLDNAEPPAVMVQLERLALPNLGADFGSLGILKKK